MYARKALVGIGADEVTEGAVLHRRKAKARHRGPIIGLVPAAVAWALEDLWGGDFALDEGKTFPGFNFALSAATGHWQPPGKAAFVVLGPHPQSESHLPEIAHAADAKRLSFGFGQRWQKHAGQNPDDGDHHQQFDEREGASAG